MMSIEVTRECPLHCPGCYAYGENHLGGEVNLRSLSDYRGDELVERIVDLVRQYRPVHLSLVGGEPLVRHRELSRLLPILSGMNVYTMVVTSAVIPIPREWMAIRNVGVTVSVDGLPEHHDVRRHPATYERILKNISGCKIAVHWTITRPMLERREYLEEYLAFWNARPEVRRMWASLYTPQKGEQTPEMLSAEQRQFVAGRVAPSAAELSQVAHEYWHCAGHAGSSDETERVHLFDDVDELLGRSAHARGTLHFWRRPGLFAMRMRDQQWSSLAENRSSGAHSQDQQLREGVDGHRKDWRGS